MTPFATCLGPFVWQPVEQGPGQVLVMVVNPVGQHAEVIELLNRTKPTNQPTTPSLSL